MRTDLTDEVRETKKLLACPICLDVLSEPTAGTCDHVFCRVCLELALTHKPSCPLCGQKMKKKSMRVIDHLGPIIQCFADLVAAIEQARTTDELVEIGTAVQTTSLKQAPSSSSSPILAHVAISATHTSPLFPNPAYRAPSTPPSTATELQDVAFFVGTLVNVLPRTWAGINKLGGVGRVEAVSTDETGGPCYAVRYVLDGNRDDNVPAAFVELYVELGRSGRRSKQSMDGRGSDADAQPGGPERARKSSLRSPSCDADKENTITQTGAAPSRTRPILLLTTAIESKYNVDSKLEQFVSMAGGASLGCSFSEDVTHLVVSTDRNNVMKQRTMKYMQALAKGIWVVSSKWVEDSLAAGRVLAEAAYEVRGNIKAYVEQAPRRARLARTQTLGRAKRPLLDGFAVLLFGMFPLPGPARSDLEFLLTYCGGRVFNSVATFCATVAEEDAAGVVGGQRMVLCSSADCCMAEDLRRALPAPLPVVSAAWVMDCVTNFSPISPSKYLIAS